MSELSVAFPLATEPKTATARMENGTDDDSIIALIFVNMVFRTYTPSKPGERFFASTP